MSHSKKRKKVYQVSFPSEILRWSRKSIVPVCVVTRTGYSAELMFSLTYPGGAETSFKIPEEFHSAAVMFDQLQRKAFGDRVPFWVSFDLLRQWLFAANPDYKDPDLRPDPAEYCRDLRTGYWVHVTLNVKDCS